jgi:uncharacterized protein YllA (UPF0747 family)
MSSAPVPPRVAPADIPGLNPIARLLATDPSRVADLLPDTPARAVVEERVRTVLAGFRPRATPPADPSLQPFTSGQQAAISTGQQCGLLTGPLLTLTKALATIKASRELAGQGLPTAPLFWCASEDHDLVEVTRVWTPSPGGAEERGPQAEPLSSNRRPVGGLMIEGVNLETFLTGTGAPEAVAEAQEFVRLSSGKTYFEAFRDSLGWLLGRPISFADAARHDDKPDLVPLARRIVRERGTVRQLLAERAAKISEKGFDLQVKSDRRALPLFAIAGGERLLLLEEEDRFWLKGEPEGQTYSESDVLARFEAGEWLPSFSALTRPLAASTLYPIAATVLGPAEIAYWAQMYPLFGWAGVIPPVILPRPMVLPLEPSARRALAKSGLPIETVLQGERAALIEQGKSASAQALTRLATLREELLRDLDSLKDEILGLDPNLKRPFDSTRQNLDFALGKFTEKAAESAGRTDTQSRQALERLLAAILPTGQLAERILSPLSYVERFGREKLVTAIEEAIRWDEPGLYVIEL